MAIIKSYPVKTTYFAQDRLILSDMQPDDEGKVSGETKNITLATLKTNIGGGGLTLTTTGTSGASTFDADTNTLNIPNYTSTPAGSNTQVQFNNSGSFGASSNLRYVDSTRILTIGDQDTFGGIVNIEGGATCGIVTGKLYLSI